jgi:hypothetical protein
MEKIGMETESSDRSPPFAVEDEACLGRTDRRPIDRERGGDPRRRRTAGRSNTPAQD